MLIKYFSENIRGDLHKTCDKCRNNHKCELCDFKSHSKCKLIIHISAVHNKIKDYVCDRDNCNARFSTKSDLTRHQNFVHNKIKDYVCDRDNCNARFSTKSKLTRHQNSVHDKIKDFMCNIEDCGILFPDNSSVKQHITQVHNNGTFQYNCDYDLCNYQSNNNYNYKRHNETEHTNCTNICKLCDSKFKSFIKLQQHSLKYHNSKIKRFKCEICNKLFENNCGLFFHIKSIHKKIKDFKCDICIYECSSKGELKMHILQVHTNDRRFLCKNKGCTMKFFTNGKLTRHLISCTGDMKGISGLELRCKNALSDLGFCEDEDYIFNHSFLKLTDWCGKRLRPDFRFLNHKIIIETDGPQHKRPCGFGSPERAEELFEKIKQNDKMKNDFCVEFGYKMIRIPYKDINNILKILSVELYDIVDW